MTNQPAYLQRRDNLAEKVQQTLQMLNQRQMASGGFSYWPSGDDNDNNTFASVYAMHFLTEARVLHYPVPNEVFYAGIAFIKELVSHSPTSLEKARLQAYAIYILTRNEIITTAYLSNLEDYLDSTYPKVWKQELTGAYVAASLSLLKNQAQALDIINRYQPQIKIVDADDFYNTNTADAQYLYLLANHFPELAATKGEMLIKPLVAAMNSSDMNTIFASYTSLALAAFDKTPAASGSLSLSELLMDNSEHILNSSREGYVFAAIAPEAKIVRLLNPDKQPVFYQLSEAGFDRPEASQPAVSEGMEIFREYRDKNQAEVQSTALGSEIEVRILVRGTKDRYLSNIAIVDLLPGGFEVVRDSVKVADFDYADIREDRVLFFTSLDNHFKEISYRIKAISPGSFSIPFIVAEAMYTPQLRAQGALPKPARFEINV
jgi:hypothetical protein